ncbi:MAG: YceI family protein [Bacteroidia bacterium]|nr:YceI family protein [Bacteroidia bacterium]
MRTFLILALCIICSISLSAQMGIQTDPEITVNFKIKNLGINVKGNFSEINITSFIDQDNLDKNYINAYIKVNSINTGNNKRDEHLLKEDFFDADKYEEIRFKSAKIEKLPDNSYVLTGNLTIKNTTKLISIPLEIIESKSGLNIISNFEMNRRDFDIGGSSWILSDIVKVEVIYNKTNN